jgi:DeoR family fructose operon transcriptional repressor
MTTSSTVDGEHRRRRLIDLLEREGGIRHESAATELGVSAMTIRRDLVEMEAAGLVRRVRGGALPPFGPRPFRERSTVRARAKAVIAEKAARLLPAAGAIAIDASSTTGRLGASIGDRPDLIVATNSWENFTAVRNSAARPVLIGGELEAVTDSFVGPLACRAAGAMQYRRFFASASAADASRGTMDVTLAEAQVKQELARSAEETILCVDSSKLGQRDIAVCLLWPDITALITELDPRDARLDAFRDLTELI